MANQRVQVERLRAPTSSTPVARPVDTYVRPAQQAEVKSTAMQLFEALAPSVEKVAKVKYQEQLKAEAEAEAEARRQQARAEAEARRRAAQREAFEAKLTVAQTNAEWNSEFRNNYDTYMDMDLDAVGAARNEFYNERLSNITNPDVLEAVQQDFLISGVNFMSEFEEQQFIRQRENALQTAFNTFNVLPLDTPQSVFNNELNTAFGQMRDLYNMDARELNDQIMTYAYQRVRQGDRRYWDYMVEMGQHNTGSAQRQQVVAQIMGEIERQDAAAATAQYNATIEQARLEFEDQIFETFQQQGSAALAYEAPLVVPTQDGTGTRTITYSPSEMETLVARRLQQQDLERVEELRNHVDPQIAENAEQVAFSESVYTWATSGLDNRVWKAQLNNAANLFNVELNPANAEQDLARAASGYALFNRIYEENPRYARSLMSNANDYAAMIAVKTMMEDQASTFEDAFMQVRRFTEGGMDLPSVPAAVIRDKVESINDLWGMTNIQNGEYPTSWLRRNAEIFMMRGMTPEAAVDQAAALFQENHIEINNRWVDVSGLRYDPNAPQDLERAFNLVLQEYEEVGGVGIERLGGQTDMFGVVDEFGRFVEGGAFITKDTMQSLITNANRAVADAAQADADADQRELDVMRDIQSQLDAWRSEREAAGITVFPADVLLKRDELLRAYFRTQSQPN